MWQYWVEVEHYSVGCMYFNFIVFEELQHRTSVRSGLVHAGYMHKYLTCPSSAHEPCPCYSTLNVVTQSNMQVQFLPGTVTNISCALWATYCFSGSSGYFSEWNPTTMHPTLLSVGKVERERSVSMREWQIQFQWQQVIHYQAFLNHNPYPMF